MKDLILRISIKNKLFIIFISIFFLFSFIGNEKVYAHQPFFIKSYNKIENGTGIKISDASVSHAFYGQFDNKKQFTLIDLDISDGEDLFVEVLIPNKFPENEISTSQINKNDMKIPFPIGGVVGFIYLIKTFKIATKINKKLLIRLKWLSKMLKWMNLKF